MRQPTAPCVDHAIVQMQLVRIALLTQVDARTRLTSKQALRHPWIENANKHSQRPLTHALSEFKVRQLAVVLLSLACLAVSGAWGQVGPMRAHTNAHVHACIAHPYLLWHATQQDPENAKHLLPGISSIPMRPLAIKY